jgi:putative two-component system hydrogenase maturation factor HypX/HoxX
MALEWKDRYKIGDSRVDSEHQEWFRLADKFLTEADGQSMQECGEAFYQYTKHHFFREENLMRELNYPFTATHAKEHGMLVNTLRKILDVGRSVLSKAELEDFVAYWLIKHITSCDAPFTVYVRRNNVAPAM